MRLFGPTESFAMPSWNIAAFTHRGRVRPSNEDGVAVNTRILTGNMDKPLVLSAPDDSCILMIADGMGGHAHGAMASRAVLDYLVAAIGSAFKSCFLRRGN